ncbi:MAG: hypothetical protein KTR31_29360 [Myxococcales bacterium]|nr:hypothetical protein [Myxococcales bacterium]
MLTEMMTIVARNTDRLLDNLEKAGWRLGSLDGEPNYWNNPPWWVPGRSIAPEGAAEQAENVLGALPSTYKAFIRHVGAVSLAGFHPDWPGPERLDPLVLDRVWGPGLESLESEREEWLEDEEDEPWLLPLAPDRFHKANISGGGPYGFALPSPGIEDAFVWWEAGSAAGQRADPFVEYLRLAFRWGGFPGLEFDEAAQPKVPVGDLCRGLEHF